MRTVRPVALCLLSLLLLVVFPVAANGEPDPRYAFSFGSPGFGNGQFSYPTDIAIDSNGNLWVVDAGQNRIQEFNAKGEYLSKFGSSGTGNGQFSGPEGITIDASGNIWVADTWNERVQKFNSKGEYLSQFKTTWNISNESIFPSGLAIDSSGNIWITWREGSFILKYVNGIFKTYASASFPRGILVDSDGIIWVASEGCCVQAFSQTGEELETFMPAYEPGDLAFAGDGNPWITIKGVILRITPESEVLSELGAFGSGEGEFNSPRGIAVDASGNLWIVDELNDRVEKWVPNRPTVTTEAASGVTTTTASMNATVNPNGVKTTYHFEIGTNSSYGFSIPTTDKEVGSESKAVKVSDEVAGLKSKTTYHFRIVATNVEGTSYGKDETFTTK